MRWQLGLIGLGICIALTAVAPARQPVAAAAVSQASRIERALASPTEVEFIETPLSDVRAYLSIRHEVPVVLDMRGLEDEGISTDEPVTIELSGVSLAGTLELMLSPLGLTAVETDEAILITTLARAATMLETRVYAIGDLLDSYDPRPISTSTLLDTLESTVAPDSWRNYGGKGTATVAGSALVVFQTQRVQRQVARLLDELRRVQASQRELPVPPAE